MNEYKKTEKKILDALAKIRNGKGSLYDIATWCLELFTESDTYADAIGIEPDEVVHHIESRFLKDFAVDLSEVVILMKFFPDRVQWNRPILDLLDDAHAQIAEKKREEVSEQPRRTRRVVKRQEHEQVQKELAEVQLEVKRKTQAQQETRSELDKAKDRIRELEMENAQLRGRIAELERLIELQSASA